MLIFAATLTVTLYALTDISIHASGSFALRVLITFSSMLTSKCKCGASRREWSVRADEYHSDSMSALGQKQTFAPQKAMSAFPPESGHLRCTGP